jgi:hypothetical protein
MLDSGCRVCLRTYEAGSKVRGSVVARYCQRAVDSAKGDFGKEVMKAEIWSGVGMFLGKVKVASTLNLRLFMQGRVVRVVCMVPEYLV